MGFVRRRRKDEIPAWGPSANFKFEGLTLALRNGGDKSTPSRTPPAHAGGHSGRGKLQGVAVNVYLAV